MGVDRRGRDKHPPPLRCPDSRSVEVRQGSWIESEHGPSCAQNTCRHLNRGKVIAGNYLFMLLMFY